MSNLKEFKKAHDAYFDACGVLIDVYSGTSNEVSKHEIMREINELMVELKKLYEEDLKDD